MPRSSGSGRARVLLLLFLAGLWLVAAGAGVLACGGAAPEPPAADDPPPGAPASEPSGAGREAAVDASPAGQAGQDGRALDSDTSTDAAATGPKVVFLGDSLTAGYGLSADQAFPARVGEILAAEGWPVEVVNAGVSGDTTAGGRARLDWVLRQEPAVVVVGLGANDGLRGLSVAEAEENLRAIVERSRAAGARVLLLGMKIPPSYGPDYATAFEALYPRLARELEVALVPFLLEGVAADPELNLADGIHPNAEGQRRVARTVAPALEAVLEEDAVLEEEGSAEGG